MQVRDPDAVAPRGADVRGHEQPAAVVGDVDAVVGVLAERSGSGVRILAVEAGAVDQDVGVGRRADPVAPDPAVEGLLARRRLVRGDHPDVEELLAAGQPGDVGVAAAVDRGLDVLAGRDVEDVQHRLLVPAGGELVDEQAARVVRGPGVERGRAGGVERGGVDQHPLGARQISAHGIGDVQDAVLLARLAAGREAPPGPPGRHLHPARRGERAEGRRQGLAAGEGVEVAARQRVLCGRPRPGARVVRVLQPAVRVGDAATVEVVDEVQALGRG